jgi:pyrophosphatase PpaX
MVKAVIFDIGGVLVKNDEALLEAIFLALKENGLTPTGRDEVFKVFGQSNLINVETAVKLCYSGNQFEEMVEKCFSTFTSIFPLKVVSSFQKFPGNREALEKLAAANIKMGVFTGLNRVEAEVSLDCVGLKDFFTAIVTVDDVKNTRPDPEGLLAVSARLDCKLDECIYVGDTVADIQMAKNAKVPIVCVKTGVQSNELLEKYNPEYFVDNLTDMLKQTKIIEEAQG